MKKLNYFILILILLSPIWNSCELEETEIKVADLVGFWDVQENSKYFKKSLSGYYRAEIVRDPSDTAYIFVKNFYELKNNLRAKVTGRDISIPQQTLNGYYVQGFGRVSVTNNRIDFFYRVDFRDGDIDTVDAVYNRVR